MSIISVTLPSDGTSANVVDYNDPINDILATVNGQLDDDNIASLSGTKITAGTLPATALNTSAQSGWLDLGATPNTVTYNGNRSYDLVFNSTDLTDTVSAGTRLRTTRTVAAPTSVFSLDGTNDFYNDTSLTGMTFTDDFCAGAWIYMTSYPAAGATVISRYNGTSGWYLNVDPNGRLSLAGFNGGSGNVRYIFAYTSVPLNRWVHVAGQLDMSANSATPTTSYLMMDGVDIPAQALSSGTNPTALIQAGNLEIGSHNGGTSPFPGYIDQVFVSSAKITQANMRTLQGQAITAALVSTHSIVSAYSGGSVTDINTTNANNLTAQNGATTVASSPFGNRGVSSTLDYGIVTAASFSTNTTLTVQVPDSCTIPTSGGVSAVSYSASKAPYGFPLASTRWVVELLHRSSINISIGAFDAYFASVLSIIVPVGSWLARSRTYTWQNNTSSNITSLAAGWGTSTTTVLIDSIVGLYSGVSGTDFAYTLSSTFPLNLTSATTYTYHHLTNSGGGAGTITGRVSNGATAPSSLRLEFALL